jgi:hypothetical protein
MDMLPDHPSNYQFIMIIIMHEAIAVRRVLDTATTPWYVMNVNSEAIVKLISKFSGGAVGLGL